MDKELTVPKWVLINWPKIPQMPQNLSAQFVCPSPKVWAFNKKRFHWASVVREQSHAICISRPLNQTRKLNNRYPPYLLSVYKIEDLLEIFLKLYSYYVHNKFDIMIYMQVILKSWQNMKSLMLAAILINF